MRTYTTKQGDTFDKAARILYTDKGREKLTASFIDANLDYADTVIFSAGQVLKVPDVDLSVKETLPLWMR